MKTMSGRCDASLSAWTADSKKTLHNVQSYHTTSTQVGKVAFIAGAKKLVLTHFVPTKFNKNNLKKIVKRDFGKDPIIGEDLLTIKV